MTEPYDEDEGTAATYVISIQQQQQQIHHIDLDDAIQQGIAVVRDVSQLRALSESLTYLEPLFPQKVNPESVQQYLQSVIESPQHVNSNELAEFLSAVSGLSDDSSQPLHYVQYLLPNIQSSPVLVEPIPRFGTYQQTVDTVLPGWWLIWYLRTDTVVDLQIYTTGPSHTSELVHEETCDASTEDHHYSYGSYRVLSEPIKAVLQIKGKFIRTPGMLYLESAAVPHEAFKAACTAANDLNASRQRRRTAPLLSLILDNDHDVTVTVQEYNKDIHPVNNQTMLNVDPVTSLSDKLMIAEKLASERKAECDQLRDELSKTHLVARQMKRQLDMADSERRVWSVVRGELQAELSRLSTELESEQKEKAATVAALNQSRQEAQEIQGQLRLTKLQASNGGGATTTGSQSQIAELVKEIRKLEQLFQAEKDKNLQLHGSLEKAEKIADARVAKAEDEAHEAKMARRNLETQSKQLKQSRHSPLVQDSVQEGALRNTRLFRKLHERAAHFQHPDPRLNAQLSTLRDRFQKLSSILTKNPTNSKNLEILGMLEKAIYDIVDNNQS